MSNLNENDIKILSKLCHIELKDEEIEDLLHDFKQILDYSEQLQEVDVSDLTPYCHMEQQGVDSLREDEVGDLLAREVFLENAPDQVGGMIRVPPVIKNV